MDALQRHRSLYKGTTPPWKDTYRQRCVDRLRDGRSRLLDRYRRTGEPGAAIAVQEVMEEEWSLLQAEQRRQASSGGHRGGAEMFSAPEEEAELAVLEEIHQELLNHERSVLADYEQSLVLDQDLVLSLVQGMDERRLVCPVCRRNHLDVGAVSLSCPCGVHINTEKQNVTSDVLQRLLEVRLSEHTEACLHAAVFFVAPNAESGSNLMMSCEACDFMSVIV